MHWLQDNREGKLLVFDGSSAFDYNTLVLKMIELLVALQHF